MKIHRTFSARIISLVILSLMLLCFCAPFAHAVDADDDNDGVDNGQEVIDGTSPSDPDSYIEHAATEYCQEWNGFLTDITQVLELRNAGCAPLTLSVELRGQDGTAHSSTSLTIPPSRQFDIIANVLSGFEPSSYGQICATITGGNPDTLDTQMSFYQLAFGSFDFAFAVPYTNARTGNQYLAYNHYFPTLSAAELSNFSAGYVQISNEESTQQSGALVFYDAAGAQLTNVNVSVPAHGRFDINTHQNGSAGNVGLIKWQPASADKKFRLILNRYYFGSNGVLKATAALPAKRGAGNAIASPFSTVSRVAVLELSNTLSSAVQVAVSVRTSSGSAASTQPGTITIPARGTRHLVLNDYLAADQGKVQIQPGTAQSVIASLLEYGIDGQTGRLSFANAGDLKAGFGTTQRVSYNNFLGSCTLRLANITSAQRTATISMTRFDGTAISIASPITVPANGAAELNICGNETQTAYGEVAIVPSVTESIVGELVRKNQSEGVEFRVPLTGRSICTAGISLSPSSLTLTANGSPDTITVTNTSSGITATNIQATLPSGWTDVVQDSSNCASVAPGASCNLQFVPGATSYAQESVPIQGSNTLRALAQISVGAPSTTTLSASISSLALSVNDTGLASALTGTPRTITITNTGSIPALSVAYSPSPALPSGSTISPASCGTIAPAGSCALTITPGSTPSAAAGDTNPTPINLTIQGTNTNSLTPSINILTYGSVYQSGYVFAIDDTTPSSSSAGGKVAALTDQVSSNTGIFWASDGASSFSFDNIPGITDTSTSPPCNGGTDGACNTGVIVNFYPSINTSLYAAGTCKAVISGFSDWYLPSICELGYDTSTGNGCGTQGSPTTQNIVSGLIDNGDIGNLSGSYWSSTENASSPTVFTWSYFFAGGGGGSFVVLSGKANTFGVRCARSF